jgi:hypothetical protein
VTEIIIILENREPDQKPLPFYFAPVTLTRWRCINSSAQTNPRERVLSRGFWPVSAAAAI